MIPAVLLALAASASPAPAASEPLAGCRAIRAGEDAWEYECGGLRANVEDHPDEQLDDAYFEGLTTSIRSQSSRVELGRERRQLGGQSAEVLTATDASRRMITALVRLPRGTRVVQCVGTSADGCGQVMDALARRGWRAGDPGPGAIVVGEAQLRLRGRTPELPRGCSGRPDPTGGKIECPGGFTAAWAEVADEDLAARAIADVRGKFGGRTPKHATTERVPCRIAGADAVCERIVASAPASGAPAGASPLRFVVMSGWATLDGRPTVAVCTARGPEPVPPPCAVLFELR